MILCGGMWSFVCVRVCAHTWYLGLQLQLCVCNTVHTHAFLHTGTQVSVYLCVAALHGAHAGQASTIGFIWVCV